MWTQFWDMHSGGRTKAEPYEKIYIEAPQREAKVIFYNRFGRNPERVTCTCCGEDYSISESATLDEATAFHRGFDWDEQKGAEKPIDIPSWNDRQGGISVEDYIQKENVLVIRAAEIKPSEREGDVPEEGYVWSGG